MNWKNGDMKIKIKIKIREVYVYFMEIYLLLS